MSNKPRIKACAYLRMSTDKQETSIPIQKKRLLELAEQYGYEIIQWYKDEGLSGSKDPEKRLDWMRLLSDAKAGAEWEVILCFNRSRFSRLDTIEEGFAKQILREAGKRLHCADEGLMDWHTFTGRMMDAFHTEASNSYAVTLAKATLEGKLQAFQEGRAYGLKCSYGMARRLVDPIGNVHEVSRTARFTKPKDWTQTFIPGDPQETETVLWLFTTYASKDVGLRWLADQVNAKKCPAPDGGMWCASLVGKVLLNPVYVGDTAIGRVTVGRHFRLDGEKAVENRRGKRATKGPGLIREGTHEGIIDRDLWNLVQAKIKRRTRNFRHLSRGEGGYALKGVLYCGHCKKPMYGRRNVGKKKSRYVTYVCGSGLRIGKESGCKQWIIRETDILPAIIGRLADEIDLRLLSQNSVQPPAPPKGGKDEIARLQKKLADLDKKISQGTERFLTAPAHLTADLDAKLTEWKVQKALLAEQIEKTKEAKPEKEQVLQEWHRWFTAEKAQLVHVQRNPEAGATFDEGARFTPESFRETLLRFGCRVICWWRQRSSLRWDVDRLRIMLGVPDDPVEKLKTRAKNLARLAAKEEAPETPENQGENGGSGSAQSGDHRSQRSPDCAAIIDLVFSWKDLFPSSFYAAILPLALELRAKGHTLRQIADALNSRGMRTLQGTHWNVTNVHGLLRRNPPTKGASPR